MAGLPNGTCRTDYARVESGKEQSRRRERIQKAVTLSNDPVEIWQRRDLGDLGRCVVGNDGKPKSEFGKPDRDGVHVDSEQVLLENPTPKGGCICGRVGGE
jgi:hypothetical protein